MKNTAILLRSIPYFFMLALLNTGCKRSEKKEGEDPPSYTQKLTTSKHPYNSSKWVQIYRQWQEGNPNEKVDHCLNMGIEQIRSGKSEAGIQTLDSLINALTARNKSYEQEVLQKARAYLALGYLRQGEQQNCIENHKNSSCIIPLDSSAVYRITEGTEKAIQHYTHLLRADSEDYESRYLLNLAYMTLGGYPEDIPAEFLIQNPLLNMPAERRVIDRAMDKNLAIVGLAGGAVSEDFNRDGFLDLATSSWDVRTNIRFFANSGKGIFEEKSSSVGLQNIPGGLNMMQTDYNNDGWPDLFILRGGWLGLYGKLPNTLLRNNGKGPNGKISFTDVTESAGFKSEYPTQTAAWADFNNDGRLDVFIGNESAVTGTVFPSELYLNDRAGTFSEVAKEAKVQVTDTLTRRQYVIKGVTTTDYDNDGWIDLFISTRNERNFLFRNTGLSPNGIPQFHDVTEQSGLGGTLGTFTCWSWDYNNDGHEDLLVAGFNSSSYFEGQSISHDFGRELLELEHQAQTGLLYKNNGDGTFTDTTEETGLDKILYMMGGNFGDIDNDGWLDFYCGNGDPDLRSVIPNRMFRFDGKRFQEITNQGFGHIQKGHGTAFADFDKDGDQDIYMVVGGFYEGDIYQNIYLENRSDTANHFVEVRLQGSKSNSYGVGSRLRLVINDAGKRRELHRTVNSGGSFGASSLTQHIGLGQAKTIDTLAIRWAGSHTEQVLTDLEVDTVHVIKETWD
jgi:hypothetical protein